MWSESGVQIHHTDVNWGRECGGGGRHIRIPRWVDETLVDTLEVPPNV